VISRLSSFRILKINLEFHPSTSITLDTSSTLLFPIQGSTVSFLVLPLLSLPSHSRVEKKGDQPIFIFNSTLESPMNPLKVLTNYLLSPTALLPSTLASPNSKSCISCTRSSLPFSPPPRLTLTNPLFLLTHQAQPRRYSNLFIEKINFFWSTHEIRSSW